MAEADLHRAVFLDRDSTIIEDMEFSVDPERMRPLAGALDALRRLQEAGYLLVVASNQSGVARGLFDEEQLERLHELMVRHFKEQGVRIAGVYHCPHYPEGKVPRYAIRCDCRKPAPGMLQRAAREHGIDLAGSWMSRSTSGLA